MDLIFKAATIDDIDLIHSLAREVFYPTYGSILSPEQLDYMFSMMYSIPSLREQIEVKGAHYFILYKGAQACGYLSVVELREAEYHLDKIYLLPPFQRLGLGRKMVEYAVEYVRTLSCGGSSKLTLNVNRANRAVEFYSAMGFSVERSGDFDIGNGYFMNDYIMAIKVAP